MIKTIAGRFLNKNNRNTLIYLASSIFGAAVGFVMLRQFTVFLGPEDIGIFGYVTAVNTFLIPFFTLMLDNFYIKEIYRIGDGDKEAKKELLGTIVIFIFIWTLLLTALLTGAGYLLFQNLGIKVAFFPYMFYTLLSNLFLGVTMILMLQYRMLQKPWHYFLINAMQTTFVIGIGYYLVVWLHWGIYGRIVGVLLGSLLLGIISTIMIFPHIKFTINWKLLKQAIVFSFPLIPYSLANLLYDFLDRYYLERYFPDLSFTGLYNMGIQYALIISMLSLAFYRAYETEIFRLTAEGNQKSIAKTMIMLNNVILCLAVPLIVASGPLINYLSNGRFPGSALIASILIVCFFFRSAYIMLNTVLTALSKTKEIFWFSLLGLVFVILASMLIVPVFGNIGTACIKLLLYLLMFGSSFLVIRKAASYKKYILHTLFTGSAMAGLVYTLHIFHFI